MRRRVAPSAERDGATARPFDPLVGVLLFGLLGQLLDHVVEAVEKRRLEDEARGDVLAGHRREVEVALGPVLGRIGVDAVGIAFEDGAHVRRQLRIVVVHRLPDVHRMDEIVAWCRLEAVARRELPAGCEDDRLDGVEVVFRMCKAEAEGGVGVGLAENVRHAEIVAADVDVIARRLGENVLGRKGRRFQPLAHEEIGKDGGDEHQSATTPFRTMRIEILPRDPWREGGAKAQSCPGA